MSELREAADILRGMEGPTIRTVRGKRFISEREHFAAMTLALAYLADHPADDAEPAVWPWLGRVGFTQESDELSTLRHGAWFLQVSGGTGGSLLWLNNCPVEDCPTRGHVRRLLNALGVKQ